MEIVEIPLFLTSVSICVDILFNLLAGTKMYGESMHMRVQFTVLETEILLPESNDAEAGSANGAKIEYRD